jgi:hypothetical protein
MPSVIDVCNLALSKVGHGSITSLDDGTTTANLCDKLWPIVRDAMLRDHPWNFAVGRKTLAANVEPPDWGFSSRFSFPSDCLRLLEVRDLSTREYQVEGRNILANASVLYIRYVRRVTDPNEYDSAFVDAVAIKLAIELCEPLTQSSQKKQMLLQEYEEVITRAKRADGQENPPTIFEEDDWIKVRY